MDIEKAIDFIFLKSGERFEKVKIAEINFLRADGSYTKLITPDRVYTLSGNLNQMLKKMAIHSLMRIHRSYVVNVDNITSLDNDHVYIGEQNLPIGRSHRNDVNKVLRRIF